MRPDWILILSFIMKVFPIYSRSSAVFSSFSIPHHTLRLAESITACNEEGSRGTCTHAQTQTHSLGQKVSEVCSHSADNQSHKHPGEISSLLNHSHCLNAWWGGSVNWGETSKPTAVCSNIGTNSALRPWLNYYANQAAQGAQRSDVTHRNKYINAL